LESVEWLYSDESRRTGRSFLIALVLLRQMVHHPGRWIRICDHVSSFELNDLLSKRIIDLAHSLRIDLSEIIQRRNRGFFEIRLRPDYIVPDSVMTALTEFEVQSELRMPTSSSPTSFLIDLEPKITLWDVIQEADASTQKEDLFYCYIVKTRSGKLYTGIAKDVKARVAKHNAGKGSKCLKGQLPVKLVWMSKGMSRSEASNLEYNTKQLSHSEKLLLIGKG
jgi:putative endonuclease